MKHGSSHLTWRVGLRGRLGKEGLGTEDRLGKEGLGAEGRSGREGTWAHRGQAGVGRAGHTERAGQGARGWAQRQVQEGRREGGRSCHPAAQCLPPGQDLEFWGPCVSLVPYSLDQAQLGSLNEFVVTDQLWVSARPTGFSCLLLVPSDQLILCLLSLINEL